VKNNNLVFYVLVAACLAAGFISGWTIKECVSEKVGFVDRAGGVIKVHDTIKTPLVEYRVIPGKGYNVDSIVYVVNRAWKDSLKNLYGRGLFEAKFSQQDNLGKREITLDSRIPVDPEAEVTIDEELKLPEVYPIRNFGIYAGLSYEVKNEITAHVGLKYYVLDFRNFSLSGFVGSKYLLSSKTWIYSGKIEGEVRF
jgi:hypothetical protein